MTSKTTIRGVAYDSQALAASAMGVTRATISLAAKSGTLDHVGLGPRRGIGNNKPVTIRGVRYGSMQEFARDIGVTPSQMSGFNAVIRAIGGDLDTIKDLVNDK